MVIDRLKGPTDKILTYNFDKVHFKVSHGYGFDLQGLRLGLPFFEETSDKMTRPFPPIIFLISTVITDGKSRLGVWRSDSFPSFPQLTNHYGRTHILYCNNLTFGTYTYGRCVTF